MELSNSWPTMRLSLQAAVQTALQGLGSGREEALIGPVRDVAAANPASAEVWQALALLYRACDELEPAVEAFDKAARLAPSDPKIAHGLAHARFEAGLPSVTQFERALGIAPEDVSILQGLIAALVADEGSGRALRRLRQELAARPGWLAGHWLLSRLLGSGGRRVPVDASIEAATNAHPHIIQFWQQWVFILMKTCDFARALQVIERARAAVPDQASNWSWLEAACLSEVGNHGAAEQIYSRLQPATDEGLAVYELRHLLRTGRPDLVSKRADAGHSSAVAFWPYYALAWRQLGDARAHWLENPQLIAVVDFADRLPPLDTLAQELRSLHRFAEEPIDQSVRTGTQTDGPLLSRISPTIRQLRSAIVSAVRDHIGRLPPPDPNHPQLGARRDMPVRFAGSWSVRLRGSGHHSAHIHPEGWFSSALYVALPPSAGREAGNEGWLSLGSPPESLGLDLHPLRLIEPKPGRLVLFPSTMWHSTVPITSGERLSVAFDVARPAC